jgi:hypothetical protein
MPALRCNCSRSTTYRPNRAPGAVTCLALSGTVRTDAAKACTL